MVVYLRKKLKAMSTLIKNKTITTVNPATGKSLKDYPLMTNEEASEAVKKCHEAFLEWKGC